GTREPTPPHPSPLSSPAPSQPCTPLTGGRDTVRKACQLTTGSSQAANQVPGPILPSCASPARRCRFFAAFSGASPYRPSTLRAQPRAFIRACQVLSPRAPDVEPVPVISAGTTELGILPDTGVMLESPP